MWKFHSLSHCRYTDIVRNFIEGWELLKITADVVVVGGGVMGCSILYNLARYGLTETVLLEQDTLGSGSTGLSQGILRMHYSNEVTPRMAWESLGVFKEFEAILDSPSGYTKTGYLLIASNEHRQAMEQNVAMQRRMGVAVEVLFPDEVKAEAPTMTIGAGEICAYEPESGYADPYLVTQGYAHGARKMGAVIKSGTLALDVETTDSRVTAVVTNNGRISTPVVVVAAGPWSRPLLGKLGVDVPLETVRHQVVVLERETGLVSGHPAFGDLVHFLSARPDADYLTLVGVGEEELVCPENYDRGVDAEVVEQVATRMAIRMSGMSEARFKRGWSGLFTVTPDWHPILGAVEGIEGLYLAVGFSGHGFKLSPMVGVVMAEIVAQGTASTIDVSMMDLSRFEEGRSLGSRYGMNVLA